MSKKLKITLSQINTSVGDLEGNCQKIIHEFRKAEESGCDLVVFCEMALTGYSCEDLWQKKYFIEEAWDKLEEICAATKNSAIGSGCAILLGLPTIDVIRNGKEVIKNSVALIERGEVKRIINKKVIPNYGVFDEKRYFEAESNLSLLEFRDFTLAILICEDVWDMKNSFLLTEHFFDAMLVVNSSPYSTHKHEYRRKVTSAFVKSLEKPMLYVNQVGAQDSLVFDGSSFVLDKDNKLLAQLKEFAEDRLLVEIGDVSEVKILNESPPRDFDLFRRDYLACILGLRDYVSKTGFKKVLLGMSGGIDSALVATMAVDALGSENVALYALPSRYSSSSSMDDAQACAHNLGVKLEIISIEEVFNSTLFSLKDIFAETNPGTTEENIQPRIRGMILMALSNKFGGLLLTTGNKSEMATGYATIYGDMCGAFNPLKDVYKTKVYQLVEWRNRNIPEISLFHKLDLIPQNIITKAPTAELRLNQKDSDSLPEYDILDKILFALIEEKKSVLEVVNSGFDADLVRKIAKLLYNSEYKRKQSAIGPKISDMSFDRDRRYPIANRYTL